ncbi:hypothetical protein GCM10010446_19910 [Streptomyces enissocaesilis]|uniref:Uncharacterized protein n=1 Tax=Streptomyces enissocaesilis TaxID=332589 RepID=A0ABN3X223_9ACTN
MVPLLRGFAQHRGDLLLQPLRRREGGAALRLREHPVHLQNPAGHIQRWERLDQARRIRQRVHVTAFPARGWPAISIMRSFASELVQIVNAEGVHPLYDACGIQPGLS